jgi:hypothetical protein
VLIFHYVPKSSVGSNSYLKKRSDLAPNQSLQPTWHSRAASPPVCPKRLSFSLGAIAGRTGSGDDW